MAFNEEALDRQNYIKRTIMTKEDLIRIIEETAPPDLAEDWDNTGIQILADDREVKKILTCLDICDETVEEAIEEGCDFILSHHPMFFAPVKQLDVRSAAGARVIKLINNGISVYSAHTSFDTAEGGNNDFLADLIGLSEVRASEEEPILRIGVFPGEPRRLGEIIEIIDEKLMGGSGLTFTGSPDALISKVAICTGAGAEFAGLAKKLGCDLLITGDVKYHDFQYAEDRGIAVVDAGHFETEILFCDNAAEALRKKTGGKVEILSSKKQHSPLKRYHR